MLNINQAHKRLDLENQIVAHLLTEFFGLTNIKLDPIVDR